MKRIAWLVCGMTIIAGPLVAAERPNVLFILGDNWRYPSAGALGDPMARTPAFDRVAREGVLFTHVFNATPSCSPSRAAMLTGRYPHELGSRASLWSDFPRDTPVVTQLLRDAGYAIGFSGKGWAPGNYEVSGWTENPVGPKFKDFPTFLGKHDRGKPFFFWVGNTDTATKAGKLPYLAEAKAKLDAAKLVVPPELPDCAEARDDLLNYYGGVMRLDDEAGHAIAALEAAGMLDDTLVIYTGDNGWQMPRGLANCYDAGSRVPFATRWGKRLGTGRRVDGFINLGDLGPTLLEVAGLRPPAQMTMRSFADLLLDRPGKSVDRDAIFMERERHADVRHDHLGYPMRAVRTREFLYVHNLRPERWPAGDPDVLFLHGRPYGDVDTTGIKDALLAHRDDPTFTRYVSLIFAKRPTQELYDLRADPDQVRNVAAEPQYAETLKQLRARVEGWMKATADPRVDAAYEGFDRFPYYGKEPKRE